MQKSIKDNIDIMLKHDQFSKWLGIEIESLNEGYCKLKMSVKQEMLNGFGIVHGGILFSVADSAFAFAANGSGRISVAMDVSISFTKSAVAGDIIYAEAIEQYSGYKTGLYVVEVRNVDGDLLALFKGNVYRTSKYLSE